MTRNLNRKELKRLLKYIDMWTRNDVFTRVSPLGMRMMGNPLDAMNTFIDRIRRLLYGTDDLSELYDQFFSHLEKRNGKEKHKKNESGKTIKAGSKKKHKQRCNR